jgi:tetratricopeptide (TPR) repeat protein
MASGKGKDALAAFQLAEKQGYAMANLWCQRGGLELGLGRPQEARPDLEKCLAMNPPPPVRAQALSQLGRIDLQAGKRPEAIVTLQKLLEVDPAHREGKYLLGMAYVMGSEFEKAKAILDKLIAEEPAPLAYYARAVANHGLKRKDQALSDIDNAARMAPNDPNIREWQARIRGMK